MGGDEEKQTSGSDTMTIDRETMISYGSVTPQHTDLEERPLTMEGEKSKPRRHCSKKKLLKDEAEKMTLLAIPVTFTYLLEMLPGVACVVLVGRVENIHEPGNQKVQLDAAALATMMMNVVALSPCFGLLTAMDTLCSQAHGSGQPSLMGTYSLTSIIVSTAVFSASSVILWNSEAILLLLDQPAEVSACAGQFMRILIPGIPSLYLYEIIRKVYQARNEATPMLITAAVSLLVNVILGYYLVRYTHFGWLGAAVARTFSFIISIPVVLLSVRLSMSSDRVESAAAGKCEGDEKMSDGVEFLQELWKGFVLRDAVSWDALREFFTLGVPGMLQVMFEWCAFEVVALFCGWFPDDEAVVAIGASFICMNISSISYMLYLGVSVAGSVRIGNALGANDPHRAELATHLSLAAGFFLAFVNMAIILWSRDTLPYLFTTDPDIVEKSKDLFVVAAVFQLPDAINGVFQGVFRGSGDQVIAALWNFVAYYIVGLPLGYVLGLRLGIGVEGLWEGMTAGLCVVVIAFSYITAKTDWAALAERAVQRVGGVP